MAVLCDTWLACLLVYTLVVAVSTTGCIFIAVVLYLHSLHRKYAHIPSPPRDGFFGGHMSRLFRYLNKGSTNAQALADLTTGYGPVSHLFFFHIPVVLVFDPDAVKNILTSSDNPRPQTTNRMLNQVFGSRLLGNGILTQADPAKHAEVRAMLNPMFTRKYLVSLIDQFNASADLLIERLRHKADGKTEVTMSDEFNRFTLDVITKVAFSLDVNAMRDDETPFSRALTLALRGVFQSYRFPLAALNPSLAARRFRQEVRYSIKLLRETGRQSIEQRLRAIQRQEEVPGDILTHMLKNYAEIEGEDQFIEQLVDEFLTLVFAGRETTANMLSFCLVELGNHPEIMQRLRTEVEAVLGDKDRLDGSDIGKLDFMVQVLKETLRLWPPASGLTRELSCDLTVQGYTIPAGCQIFVSSYVMARMEEYFHDPLQFNPDRFKASDDKSKFAYFPFAMGSRSCIGQQFALIEARVLLARLLHKFHFELVPGQGYGVKEEITLKPLEGCKNYIRLVE